MLRKWSVGALGIALVSAALVYLSGCNNSSENAKAPDSERRVPGGKGTPVVETKDKKSDEHGHKPGQHGGIIVEIGRDNYHAEAVFEKGGLLKLYTLGKDESRIIDVENQTIKAYVKEESAAESVEMELIPTPRTGDKEWRTSQFVGKLPKELVGKQVAVTIPIILVNGERYRIGFTSAPVTHNEGMPIGANPQDEKNLYLKPGGLYTEADIKANGDMTASQKFKGLISKHDAKPKPGEKICPISMTKANPQFTWIVNGKSYEFCCPPCVDEFVTWAKTQPDVIKAPEDYVKKK